MKFVRRYFSAFPSPSLVQVQGKAPFAINDLQLFENVISQAEEDILYDSMKLRLERRKYSNGHWDGVIKTYREREVMDAEWNVNTIGIIRRIRNFIEKQINTNQIPWLPCHIIDLHEDGYILPHVDSIKFSGDLVCGLSFFSEAIMTLSPHVDGNGGTDLLASDSRVRFLMPPRSLYIMKGAARYNYAHAVRDPSDPQSQLWGERQVQSRRRLSLIFRDELQRRK